LGDAVGFGAGRNRIAFYGGEGFGSRAQTSQQPPLPPLPTTGRNVVIGLMVGTAALLVTGILFGIHRKNNSDYLLFDAGWQFQMSLTTPLGVDGGQVAAAATAPSR
jgi:LPXTG-motif cell wall-anchored protein